MSRAKSRKRCANPQTSGSRRMLIGARTRAFDFLERRLVLDSTVEWNAPDLDIYDTAQDGAGDVVVVTSRSINGTSYLEVYGSNGSNEFDGNQQNPKVGPGDVQSIYVEGSDYADSLDLSAVTKGNGFTHVPRDGVEVFGLTGNDTIKLGDFGEYAEGGFGNDSIIGGPGPDTIYGGNADGTEGGYDYIDGQGGNDYLVAESTAGAQQFLNPGQPIASSTVYGGSGNDFISDVDAFEKMFALGSAEAVGYAP